MILIKFNKINLILIIIYNYITIINFNNFIISNYWRTYNLNIKYI